MILTQSEGLFLKQADIAGSARYIDRMSLGDIPQLTVDEKVAFKALKIGKEIMSCLVIDYASVNAHSHWTADVTELHASDKIISEARLVGGVLDVMTPIAVTAGIYYQNKDFNQQRLSQLNFEAFKNIYDENEVAVIAENDPGITYVEAIPRHLATLSMGLPWATWMLQESYEEAQRLVPPRLR